MSATTTENPAAINLRQTLGDYEIHITGDGNDYSDEISQPNTSSVNPVAVNPSSWPQDYHRVPDYRPINRQLSGPGRPNGANVAERLFIIVMFTGVALNAVSRVVAEGRWRMNEY